MSDARMEVHYLDKISHTPQFAEVSGLIVAEAQALLHENNPKLELPEPHLTGVVLGRNKLQGVVATTLQFQEAEVEHELPRGTLIVQQLEIVKKLALPSEKGSRVWEVLMKWAEENAKMYFVDPSVLVLTNQSPETNQRLPLLRRGYSRAKTGNYRKDFITARPQVNPDLE